jgi:2-polyprenyl-6-hydroxyphenyl methylase/3-demethylubiquinone-9 3-methyltransferase
LGIDASPENIKAAQEHVPKSHPMLLQQFQNHRLSFRAITAESLLAEKGEKYNLICCMEVLEHVPNPMDLLATLKSLLVPNEGIIILSTINDSLFSRVMATTLAENVLGLLEPGTHDPARLISATRLQEMAERHSLHLVQTNTLIYVPIPEGRFILQPWYNSQFSVNYIATLGLK